MFCSLSFPHHPKANLFLPLWRTLSSLFNVFDEFFDLFLYSERIILNVSSEFGWVDKKARSYNYEEKNTLSLWTDLPKTYKSTALSSTLLLIKLNPKSIQKILNLPVFIICSWIFTLSNLWYPLNNRIK